MGCVYSYLATIELLDATGEDAEYEVSWWAVAFWFLVPPFAYGCALLDNFEKWRSGK